MTVYLGCGPNFDSPNGLVVQLEWSKRLCSPNGIVQTEVDLDNGLGLIKVTAKLLRLINSVFKKRLVQWSVVREA